MKQQNKPLYIIGGIVLCLGIFFIVFKLIDMIGRFDSDVAIAIITGAITLIIPILSISLGKAYEVRTLIEKENRSKKIPIYEDLIDFLMKILKSAKQDKPLSEDELFDFMVNFTRRIMVWGADEVIVSWGECRKVPTNKGKINTKALLLSYDKLIKVIRKDLGYKNKNFKEGELLSLFITDFEMLLKDNN